MKELFIIISSKYRRPVPSKFKENLMELEHFRGSKIKPTKYQLVASQKNCQYESFVWGTQQQNLDLLYLTKHLLISRIPWWYYKKMHYLKPGPSPKWMSSCVGLVYFQSLVVLRLQLLVFILWTRCRWWKKVDGIWDIINKNGHSTFHTGKQ